MTWSLLLSWEGCSASEEARSSSVGTGIKNNLGICFGGGICSVRLGRCNVDLSSVVKLALVGAIIGNVFNRVSMSSREIMRISLKTKTGGMGAFSVGAVELSCPIEWVEFEAGSNKTRAGQLCMHSTQHCVRIWLVGSWVQLPGHNASLLNFTQ